MTCRCALNRLVMLLVISACMGLVGCSMPSNPWRFAEPPTRTIDSRPHSIASPVIVVVGRFDDPSRAPNYSSGVGQAMSDAYSRALLRTGRYEVRIDERLAAEARRYARFDSRGIAVNTGQSQQLTEEQVKAREKLGQGSADVEYVVIGKITDFYHTRDLPEEVSRRGIIGRRNEAVVSFDIRIVDMQTMQVVGTDHLVGTVDAGRVRSHELYENIALDSYVFWNTPLGRAGSRAIDRAVNRSIALMPAGLRSDQTVYAQAPASTQSAEEIEAESLDRESSTLDERTVSRPIARQTTLRFNHAQPQILRVDGTRNVTIMGGRNIGVKQGDRFFISQGATRSAGPTLVNDPVTNRPLVVAITDVAETTATGWLLGQKPRQLDLRGMRLELTEIESDPAPLRAGTTTDSPR